MQRKKEYIFLLIVCINNLILYIMSRATHLLVKKAIDYDQLTNSFLFQNLAELVSKVKSVNFIKLMQQGFNNDFIFWVQKNSNVLDSLVSLRWLFPEKDSSNNMLIKTYYGDNIYIISSGPEEPDFIDAKESTILFPYGEIPKLWLWVAFIPSRLRAGILPSLLPENIAHNKFILTTLKQLKDTKQIDFSAPNQLQLIDDFIKDNESIKKIRSSIVTSGGSGSELEYLGAGQDGVAFKINETMVLKIFSRIQPYQAVCDAMKRLYESPLLARTEANIYDAGVIGKVPVADIILYYYIIEYMHPVNQPNSMNGNFFERMLDEIDLLFRAEYMSSYYQYMGDIDNPVFANALRNKINVDAKEIAFKLENICKKYINYFNKTYPNLRKNWFKNLAAEIIHKIITGREDLHAGNIGITGYGDFRFFDPAY